VSKRDISFRPVGFCFPLSERNINRDQAVQQLRRLASAVERGDIVGVRVDWELGGEITATVQHSSDDEIINILQNLGATNGRDSRETSD
jgi:hypothetical protein